MSTDLKKLSQTEKRSDFLPSFNSSFGGFVVEDGVASVEAHPYNTRTMADELTVTHHADANRFSVSLQGYEACLMYRLHDHEIDLYHTYVPEVFRGRGIAERLCKAGFEYAKQQKLTVIPSCSYISDYYLRRHKEYEPLVKRNRTSNPLVSG